MDAQSVLAALESRGVELRVAADRLRFHPVEAIPASLVNELRAHKAELIRLLKAAPKPEAPRGRRGSSSRIAEVCALSLTEFARANLLLVVWSDVLGEQVIFAGDDARVALGDLRPVYRAHELRALIGLSNPGELRTVHEVKGTISGRITDVRPAEPPAG